MVFTFADTLLFQNTLFVVVLTRSLLVYKHIVHNHSLNQAVVTCLSDGVTPLPTALKSCSNPQKTQEVNN